MPQTKQWHVESMANQTRYFAKYGIRFNILDSSHYGIRKVNELGYGGHLIKKILRLYDVVERDVDYGLFMDLDTAILNPQVDIRDCVLDGFNYIEKYSYMLHPEPQGKVEPWLQQHMQLPEEELVKGWFTGVYKKKAMQEVWSEMCGVEPAEKYCTYSTGYSCFSNDLCRSIIETLKEKDLCPLTKSGINNLLEIKRRCLNRFDVLEKRLKEEGKSVEWFRPLGQEKEKWFMNDEDLLGLASINMDVEKIWALRNARDSFQSCALWDVTLSQKWWDSQFDWDKLYQEKSVFLHLIGGAKYKDANKQLKIQRLFKVV